MSDFIKIAEKSDTEGIIKLWNEAFGDKREEIKAFLDVYLDRVILYKENAEVVSMLTMLPVSYKGIEGSYIYAVATLKSHKKQGISTKLIEYANSTQNPFESRFSCLVPANKELFSFYEKRGYKTCSYLDKCEKEILNEPEKTKPEIITAEEYYEIRKSKNEIIEWGREDLLNIKNLYGGNFYKCKSSYFFAFCDKDTLFIKEIFAEDEEKAAEDLALSLGYKKICFAKRGKTPFAMANKLNEENIYFNIAID